MLDNELWMVWFEDRTKNVSRSVEEIRREDVRLPVHPLCMIFSKVEIKNHSQCKLAALRTTRRDCARDPVGKSWGRNVSGRPCFPFFIMFFVPADLLGAFVPRKSLVIFPRARQITIAGALAPGFFAVGYGRPGTRHELASTWIMPN